MPMFLDGARQVARFAPDGSVISSNPPVSAWLLDGVPALYGEEEGELIVERERRIPPASPFFPLALLDEAERRGWTIVPDDPLAGAAANALAQLPR